MTIYTDKKHFSIALSMTNPRQLLAICGLKKSPILANKKPTKKYISLNVTNSLALLKLSCIIDHSNTDKLN
jgi:hypothetical protein